MPSDLTGSLTTLGQRAESAAPTVAAVVIREAATEVVAAAEARWPVKTGRSRAGLAAEAVPEGAQIVDPAPYTLQIVSHGVRPWDAYVLQPMLVLARYVIPQEIGRRLLAELARGA